MKRNLDRRVESIILVTDAETKAELGRILDVYEEDNASRWDCAPDGTYLRRRPLESEPRRASQDVFMEMARKDPAAPPARARLKVSRKQ
jgi:polyphosphate kinase